MVSSTHRTLIITAAVFAVIIILYGGYRVICRLMQPPEPLVPTGELRVGIDISYAPFGMLENGEFRGIDVDLARALGDYLNLPVRIIPLGYDGLYDALETDQVDIIISALVPDPSRTNRVRYSIPYFNAGLVLVSPTTANINGMSDMTEKILAISLGSDAQTEANRWERRIPEFEIRPYETNTIALDAVRLHEADAALVDHTAARMYLRDHAEWRAAVEEVTVLPYSVATRIERINLGNAIQSALETFQRDGTLEAIFSRYL
ncbi:MAG: amino acid ABC transporter substrate-binding protein [Anaerolineae bacterium]|nr:amino acid ABC transporter substrate-binding protein [Anaerolineae bacterium]